MSAKWVFSPTVPFVPQGRGLSEDNFAQEERSSLAITMREVLQNPIDARANDNCGAVKVAIKVLQAGAFDVAYLQGLLGGEYGARLGSAGCDPLPDLSKASVLVIEDFGTIGLQGVWNNQDADGPEENWNAFWFREGEGAKPTPGSNGRAGQGKITYYRTSSARAVFGLTIRKDGQRLLMGRGAFRGSYRFQDSKYLPHSYWCADPDRPLPVRDAAEIDAFSAAFCLERDKHPGLSLVIPLPIDFDPKIAIQTIITDFYYPVVSGNLEVTIGGYAITASNVDAVAAQVLPDEEAKDKRSPFSSGFRSFVKGAISEEKTRAAPVMLVQGWDKNAQLTESAIPSEMLMALRARLESGERVSVRCPIRVKPKRGEAIDTWFDVHLQIPEDLDRVEEAYVRRDLLIGSEKHLAASPILQKSRALTVIKEVALSAFLADAEEPTHMKWNASRPRLAEDYSNPQVTLRAVRQAAPRLLALLSNGMRKRDFKALARYFTRPADEGRRGPTPGIKNGRQDTKEELDAPLPPQKPLKIRTGVDGVAIVPNGNKGPAGHELPISCVLELAYEGLDQSPFDAYDPFDFDLADGGVHSIAHVGVSISERVENRIRFDIIEPDFTLEVTGFDPNIRLRARVTYKEKSDAESVSEE